MSANMAHASVLGVRVSAVDMEMALKNIQSWIARAERHYVCVSGVHGLMESHRDPGLRRIHNAAGLVTPDGMPLVWLCRLMGFSHVRRVYGPDLMLALSERSVIHGYRHFYYGGAPGVVETLAARMQQRFLGLRVVGTYSPPFRPLTPAEDQQIVARINASGADIVWVGISTPKQERWMAEHIGRLRARVMIGVGAAFDFHAGVKKQAPHWMQQIGLEWLYRLRQEPRRLWRRYLINNPYFVCLMLLQFLGKQYPRPDAAPAP